MTAATTAHRQKQPFRRVPLLRRRGARRWHRPGAVIAPGGHPYAAIKLHIREGVIAAIDITAYTPGATSAVDSG
ncbi:hypothetical protein [Salinactinospora qingdaonensis]|uniref:Uncharacterized protein n=1 Tax=Salinactinospora qingdaonensis TaxID=702744 RepID=A0ABP7GFG0_9ACTN